MRIWMLSVILLSVCVGTARADELSDVKKENASLASENLALKAQIDALSRRLAGMQGERAVLDSKFAALTRRLADIERGINGMQTTLSKKMQETLDRIVMLESSGGVRPNAMARNDTGSNNSSNTGSNNGRTAPRPNVGKNPNTTTSVNKGGNTTIAKGSPITPRVKDPVVIPRIKVPRIRGVEGLPTTVAVVNMVEVFNGLREKSAVEEGLADLVYAVKFQQKKWSERIRAHQLDLELMEKGSLPALEKQHEIDQARIQLNVDVASARAALNRKRGERMKKLYVKMTEVCGRVANDHGFDMILFKEPEPDYKSYRSVGDLAGSRMVLRANDSVDLTGQVIRVLNREFLTGSTGG